MTSWKEISPGHFSRPIDSVETFFLALARGSLASGGEHNAVSIFAHFSATASSQEDTETALRHAWKTLRYDHPELACSVREDTIVYKVPDQAALDAWLNETFIVVPAATTKEDLLASFRPTVLATLHYLPHSSEIVLHTSHWRIDVIGGISMLHNLFGAMAEPRQIRFGDEGTHLSPGRDEAAGFGSSDEKGREAATDLFMHFISNMPSIGFPAQNLDQKLGGTRRSEIVLDSSTTSAIVSGSKERGITVTTAFHAAMIVALQELNRTHSSSSSKKYTTLGLFNIRPLYRSPYNDSFSHLTGVHVIGLPLVLEPSTYTDLAIQLKDFYAQRRPPAKDSRLDQSVIVPYTLMTAEMASQPPPPGIPAPSEPMLSSMGVVDRYLKPQYGNIALKEICVGVEMMNPQMVCYLWTWRGSMTLSVFYNETFYVESFVQDFLARVIEIVKSELMLV